jgi:hypothetical protein
MYEISSRVADEVVRFASAEAKQLEKTARSADMRGPDNAQSRKALRRMANEYHCVVAGLNTGEGVTRRSAARELRIMGAHVNG